MSASKVIVQKFFERISHGDDAHRDWLRAECEKLAEELSPLDRQIQTQRDEHAQLQKAFDTVAVAHSEKESEAARLRMMLEVTEDKLNEYIDKTVAAEKQVRALQEVDRRHRETVNRLLEERATLQKKLRDR